MLNLLIATTAAEDVYRSNACILEILYLQFQVDSEDMTKAFVCKGEIINVIYISEFTVRQQTTYAA